jgi:PAS domain S-box-containing protein
MIIERPKPEAAGHPTADACRLAAIVESSNDAIIGKTLDGRITSWNHAAQTLFGYTAAEAVGRSVQMLIPADCQQEEMNILAKLARGIRVPAFDTVRLTRSGRRLAVSVTVSPILNEYGVVIGASKIARDISQARRTEAALRVSEARLRFIIESVQIGDWDLDLATGGAHRSLLHDRCFGYEVLQPEWSYDIFLRHVHADDRAEVERQFHLANSEGTDWRVECRVVWPDASIHWIRVIGNTRNEANATGRMLGIVIDITQQKIAKEEQRIAAAYSRSLIEASLDPLVAISPQGKITDVNEASVEATGIARAQLVGHDFSDFFTAPAQARIGYQQAFSQGLVRDFPLAIRHASGRVMDVLFNAAVYKDELGTVRGVVAAARDVTERKRLDQVLQASSAALERAKSTAEKANLAKSDFLSSMSHELRSPLNAILGFAQLLDSASPALTAPQQDSVHQILKAGWYLLELINEILDLALIESGKLSLSPEPVCLAEVLHDCEAMIEPQARKSGISLAFPTLDQTWFVHADRMRMKQIFVNLLSNAIKYNRVGGHVEITCRAIGPGRTRIGFRDSGAGLSAEELAQLFQPFNRLGQEVGAEEGTGIGLVVSKRLVEAMGGAIGAQSTVGVGSHFWIELNTASAPKTALDAEQQAPGAPAAVHSRTQRRTLLCIEDNPANLLLVERMLERRSDIHLISASNGDHGIELARSRRPDAILMDINLPGISGFTALALLAQDAATARIPVIALSANAMPRDIANGMAAGFFRYLTKPVKIDEFNATLDLALEKTNAAVPSAPEEQAT